MLKNDSVPQLGTRTVWILIALSCLSLVMVGAWRSKDAGDVMQSGSLTFDIRDRISYQVVYGRTLQHIAIHNDGPDFLTVETIFYKNPPNPSGGYEKGENREVPAGMTCSFAAHEVRISTLTRAKGTIEYR